MTNLLLFYFVFLFIYLSVRDLILAINRQGIDNPLFALGVILCVGVVQEVSRGCPTGLLTLVLN